MATAKPLTPAERKAIATHAAQCAAVAVAPALASGMQKHGWDERMVKGVYDMVMNHAHDWLTDKYTQANRP